MSEVRSAAELLDGYCDVIDGCRSLVQLGDQYWNSIYLPLISSVVGLFSVAHHPIWRTQAVRNRPRKCTQIPRIVCLPLISNPARNLTMFAAFSASLCMDVGQPAGDLEVTVTNTEGESTLWQPTEVID